MAAMQYQQHSYAHMPMSSFHSNYSGAASLNTYSSAIHAMNQHSSRSLGGQL